MAIAFFAALGLPGLSAFISEVLVLLGAWQYHTGLAIIAASAVVLTAGYMLWMLQRVWLGPVNEKYANLADLTPRELVTLVRSPSS
jgi:NADH-quinone oxidoreductase subunit M